MKKTTKGYERTGKSHRGNAHKRVLVSTVGSDFRLIVLSSKEPFVHEAKGLDVFFTPTKRYQEVDGVRKEKERLTTDRQDSLTFHPFVRPRDYIHDESKRKQKMIRLVVD